VKQRSGDLTKAEREKYLERYALFKQKGWAGRYWGLFSKAFTDRVGYQCANYHHKLVKEGVLQDDGPGKRGGGRSDESDVGSPLPPNNPISAIH